MAAPLSLFLAAALWLCPLWFGPTPVVPPLLWGGICLGFWLWFAPRRAIPTFDVPLAFLLISLGLMVAWRSSSAANALAANLCLLAIGLSAYLGRTLAAQDLASSIAWAWLLAGLINSGLALAQYAGWTAEPVGTAFGFVRQRNNMASLCTLAWAALLYLYSQNKSRLGWVMLASAVLMAALAATASRTGFLQLALLASALIFIALIAPKSRHLAALCGASLVCYALAAWFLPQLIQSGETLAIRVLGSANASPEGLQLQDSRKQLWSNAWAVAQQNPLLGLGWRELAYSLHITDFGMSERFGSQADNAHNLPLQLAAELGLPFTALWLTGVIGYLGYRLYWARITGTTSFKASSLLGWGALLILALHSLLEYPLWYAPYQIALGLALGLIAPRAKASTNASLQAANTSIPWLGAALVAFCSYAAFDYHRVSQLFLSVDQRSSLYQSNAMAQAEGSWLFANQVQFAKLLTTRVTEANAKSVWQQGQQVIHFSPEPRVFKVLITAGMYLERHEPVITAELVILKRQLALIER